MGRREGGFNSIHEHIHFEAMDLVVVSKDTIRDSKDEFLGRW